MSERQKNVIEMFDGIAPQYDRLNHLLSFGIDRRWRHKTSRLVARWHPAKILDVATGTADLAIQLALDLPQAEIIGIDLSEKMMDLGLEKIAARHLASHIHLECGDACDLPFPDDSFDAVTVAFGLRNFSDMERGLQEMVRVCRPLGLVVVLEFSHPTLAIVRIPYLWYSRRLIPRIGRSLSGHPHAYRYLPSSIEAFPSAAEVANKLSQAGLNDLRSIRLSGGIATIHYGIAAKNQKSSQ